MRCLQKPYCARERGHEGVCLDGAALTAANLCTRVAELERIAEQWREERDLAEKARDALRAEVERLRGLLADAERHAQERHRERGRDRQAIEIERLREALRDASRAAHSRCPTTPEPPYHSLCSPVCSALSAALAGSPVERKPMFGGFAGVETGALVVPSDERRALAERVREACATEAYYYAGLGYEKDRLAREVRALDLDALLEKP